MSRFREMKSVTKKRNSNDVPFKIAARVEMGCTREERGQTAPRKVYESSALLGHLVQNTGPSLITTNGQFTTGR